MDVMNPPRHKDMHLMHKEIDLWTMNINLLLKSHVEKLSDNMKKAVLLLMLPMDLQDLICQKAETATTHE